MFRTTCSDRSQWAIIYTQTQNIRLLSDEDKWTRISFGRMNFSYNNDVVRSLNFAKLPINKCRWATYLKLLPTIESIHKEFKRRCKFGRKSTPKRLSKSQCEVHLTNILCVYYNNSFVFSKFHWNVHFFLSPSNKLWFVCIIFRWLYQFVHKNLAHIQYSHF